MPGVLDPEADPATLSGQAVSQRQNIRELCHDLRQPIAAIAALAAAASIESGIPESVRRRLGEILSEARRMSELTQHLLNEGLAPRPLDASRVAADVVSSARATFPGRIELSAEEGTIVVVDEVALRRALLNLVDNAARAAGSSGTVVVTVRRRGRWVDCEVGDSGPGFAAAAPGGDSLGLTIVDKVTRAHGGRLEILRSPLGGALMRLALPAPLPKAVSRRRSVPGP